MMASHNWPPFAALALLCVSSGVHGQQLAGGSGGELDFSFEGMTLPPLDYDYAKTNFTLDDVKRLLRAKCLKTGVNDPHIYERISDGVLELRRCTEGLLNLTAIYAEIEAARPHGNLDVVFGKYCQRRSLVTQCYREFNVLLLPCLNADERAQNYVLLRIVYTLLEYFCHRNGDPMALFIAEEGPECLEAHRQHIVDCLNATLHGYLPQRGQQWAIEELPELVLRPKQCGELYELERCVLRHLEHCAEATPANMVEAVFRYVRNETKCQLEVQRRQLAAAALYPEPRSAAAAATAELARLPLALCVWFLLLPAMAAAWRAVGATTSS